MEKSYEVVYGADANFASVMGVSIVSLFSSNTDAQEINLTILDSGISEIDKRKIEIVCRQFHRNYPRWIPITNINKKLSLKLKADRGSLAQFARLFLAEVYPNDVCRVLYLDCDTVVTSSISELWNFDLKGKTLAVVKDAFSKYYRNNIGLSSNDIMFNSGMMLIDLVKWRSRRVEARLINFIKEKKGNIQQGDQGVLNEIIADEVRILETKYNSVSLIMMMDYQSIIKYRKPVNFYSKTEISYAKKNPVVIHYTSGFYVIRPWLKNSNHPRKYEWLKYKKMSPWRKERLEDNNKQFYVRLFYLLPQNIALAIAGFFQAYLRPYKNRMYYKLCDFYQHIFKDNK